MMSAEKENPLIPMGALTGKPDRNMISETLNAFKEVGITQYLLYPRSGCELEYLSEEWFDTCRIFLEEGKRLNFTSFWLYDEFNWPSGQCGGKIMRENPEYALHYLQVLEQNGTWTIREGKNPARPDVLNPEAMRAFVRSTHERYAEKLGEFFGTLIKGIFSDEPSFLYVWHGETPNEERLRIACYPGMREEYAERTGRQLDADLVYCLKNHCDPFWQPVVRELLGSRFQKAFMQPIRDWCTAHNLLLTGHLMDESSPAGALRASGRPLAVTDTFSLPGMDEIFTRRHMDKHRVAHPGNGGTRNPEKRKRRTRGALRARPLRYAARTDEKNDPDRFHVRHQSLCPCRRSARHARKCGKKPVFQPLFPGHSPGSMP